MGKPLGPRYMGVSQNCGYQQGAHDEDCSFWGSILGHGDTLCNPNDFLLQTSESIKVSSPKCTCQVQIVHSDRVRRTVRRDLPQD